MSGHSVDHSESYNFLVSSYTMILYCKMFQNSLPHLLESLMCPCLSCRQAFSAGASTEACCVETEFSKADIGDIGDTRSRE